MLVDALLFLVFQAADLQSQFTLEGEAVFHYFFLLLLFFSISFAFVLVGGLAAQSSVFILLILFEENAGTILIALNDC